MKFGLDNDFVITMTSYSKVLSIIYPPCVMNPAKLVYNHSILHDDKIRFINNQPCDTATRHMYMRCIMIFSLRFIKK